MVSCTRMTNAVSPKMTPDEFLAWEREQLVERHIYFHGEIFAMSGGSPRHSRLAARTIELLGTVLGRGPCAGFTSDLRLALDDAHFAYADVVVICGPLALRPGTKDVATNPAAVFEVLSKSTESYDRGEKLNAYLTLPSLQHGLLVSQRAARVEIYTRDPAGGFHYQAYGPGETVPLDRIGANLSVDDLYAGVFELPGDDS